MCVKMSYKDLYEGILFNKRNKIGYITINNPRKLNALSTHVLNSLNEIFEEMAVDREIYGVIITGSGRSFVAGADLSGQESITANTAEGLRENLKYVDAIFDKIAEFDRPVIAAVNGFAFGGGAELALCCDIRIGSADAKIGFPEVGLGVIPCYGGPTRLPRLISMSNAKELLFTGRHFSAEEAYQKGFFSKIVEPDQLMVEAESMMKTIIERAPIAVKMLKVMINKGVEMSAKSSLEMERMIMGVLSTTEDQEEGMKAFIEKRSPIFNNK